MKSITIALWISLFALAAAGGLKMADQSVDSVQFNSGLGDDDNGDILDP